MIRSRPSFWINMVLGLACLLASSPLSSASPPRSRPAERLARLRWPPDFHVQHPIQSMHWQRFPLAYLSVTARISLRRVIAALKRVQPAFNVAFIREEKCWLTAWVESSHWMASIEKTSSDSFAIRLSILNLSAVPREGADTRQPALPSSATLVDEWLDLGARRHRALWRSAAPLQTFVDAWETSLRRAGWTPQGNGLAADCPSRWRLAAQTMDICVHADVGGIVALVDRSDAS